MSWSNTAPTAADAVLAERVAAARRALWDPRAPRASRNVTSVLIGSLLSPWMVGLPQLTLSTPERAFKFDLLPRVPKAQSPLFVVDVGANNGQFAVSIVRAGHRGLSYEPSPATCALLRQRIQRAASKQPNPVCKFLPMCGPQQRANVSVRCAAVGAAPGTIELTEDMGSSASFRIQGNGARASAAPYRTRVVKVPIVRLDDEVAPAEKNFILKTDTQGFEMKVLQGAQRLLERHAARLLMIELSSGLLGSQGSSPLELMRWISARGYDCTYVRFFAGQKRGKKLHFGPVRLPPSLEKRPTVPFEEIEALLKHVPPSNLPGWTDLLCWPALFEDTVEQR